MTQIPRDPAESAAPATAEVLPLALEVNPEMVAMARLATGYTQSECAKKIGISQAKLSKLEDGLTTTIDPSALQKLADVSGYPLAFFKQEGSRLSLGEGFFRRRADVPAKVFKRMEALINIKRMEITKLVRRVDMDHKERPSWDPDNFKNGAREVARHLRHFWSIPNGPIKDLVRIVEDAGCPVIFFDFGTPKVDGLTIYCEDGTPVILLNEKVPYVRQRSTLSHELGHIIMHRMPSAEMETQAFDFASEFMMPEMEIRPSLFPLNLEKLARLKIKWRVSMQWILKWAKEMGALQESYYRVLMMKISAQGWRKLEPYDSEWKLEKPALLGEILEYHARDLNYSTEELMTVLNGNLRTFVREYFPTPMFSVV